MPESKNLQWIKVPKRYRVTRIENNRYDLESTLPLALEFGKLPALGPGLRVESKWRVLGRRTNLCQLRFPRVSVPIQH